MLLVCSSWKAGLLTFLNSMGQSYTIKKKSPGTSPVVQWLRFCTSYASGAGSIPSQGNPVEPYFIYHDEDADMRYNVLPTLTWALFDSNWRTYSDEHMQEWEGKMLRGHFKQGADYQAGARAYFSASQDTAPALLTGSMGQKKRDGNARNNRGIWTSLVVQ